MQKGLSMKIYDIKKMEKIVESNDSLRWNGWDIEYLEKNHNGMYKINGMFEENQWHTKSTFKVEDGYWEIPDSILRKGNV